MSSGAEWTLHWSFQPLSKAAPRAVKQENWPRNDIDRFILSQLEAKGIAPSPEADRYTLIKRLYYDLLGLPPTVAEVDAFILDNRPDAYATGGPAAEVPALRRTLGPSLARPGPLRRLRWL
ncbi:MAG: DUF1549 domain-containing protein [Planctomycetales bacterium]